MVVSRLQLAYLYYLEISPTVLQNYRITAFVNLAKLQNYSLCESPIYSFKVPKSEKTTATKQINKSLWVSYWLDKFQSARPLRPPKVTANLKP